METSVEHIRVFCQIGHNIDISVCLCLCIVLLVSIGTSLVLCELDSTSETQICPFYPLP